MKKLLSSMSMSLWAIGSLVALYLIGGVIFYLDQCSGGLRLNRLPEPVWDFASTIYVPVFVALRTIWPEIFPFLI